MPFLGIGLHVLVALFFAVHAIRSGQQIYWLLILFSFPLLGSIVYFFAIYMPNSGLEFGAKKVVAAAAKTLDPTRELREARTAFEYIPTAQNQMRLALALLETGNAEEAASNYEACLKGPFAADPEIKFCAARALTESGRYATAISHLQEIRNKDAGFRAAQVSLLLARAFAGAERHADAKTEFESAMHHFGGFEVAAEYAIWAYGNGDTAIASKLQSEIDQQMKRWNSHTKDINRALLRRLNAAKGQ
ncbi:hypothetical protein [Undibacterium sp. Xuan67W]|uniref:hypothetical protein n=1 Tax=Undibacterium sp. Xuan67W TaxID=3413057 RepID=UPI003BF0AFBF